MVSLNDTSKSDHMASTTKNWEPNGSHGQETRNLKEELELVKVELHLGKVPKADRKLEIWQRASIELKKFAKGVCGEEIEWERVEEAIKEREIEEEKAETAKRNLLERTEAVNIEMEEKNRKLEEAAERNRRLEEETEVAKREAAEMKRKLRKANKKDQEGSSAERLERIISAYNNTYHRGIRCTPMEAYEGTSETAKQENGPEGQYKDKFKKRYREKFELGQEVRVARRENLGIETKELKGRFVGKAIVKEACGGDSYLVEKDDGRTVKKRHYDLKAAGSDTGGGDERIISVG
jgi:hypothetical protein